MIASLIVEKIREREAKPPINTPCRCGRNARRGSRFCSNSCAAEFAEYLAEIGDDAWIYNCGRDEEP